jgi:hypothetical protein
VTVDQYAIDNAYPGHGLRFYPLDGIFIRGVQTGRVYRIVGGAPVYVSNWTCVGGEQPTQPVDQQAINQVNVGSWAYLHLGYYPNDGEYLYTSSDGKYYRMAGGARPGRALWPKPGYHPSAGG